MVIVVLVGLSLWFAVMVARRVQKWVDEQNKDKDQKAVKRFAWAGHIHGIWWMLGAGVGGLKYIYNAWKTAPAGSLAKFGWGSIIALIAAIALFAVVRFLDRKLNPVSKGDEIEAQRDRAPTTYSYGRVTDRWEYKR